MNRIFNTAASVSLDSSSYTSPAINVVEVRTEGVLCASGDHESWGTDNDLWS